jgi:hypothetical protein
MKNKTKEGVVALCYEVQYSSGGWAGVVVCDAAHTRTGFRIRYPRGTERKEWKDKQEREKVG